jgi:hypothetical protein
VDDVIGSDIPPQPFSSSQGIRATMKGLDGIASDSFILRHIAVQLQFAVKISTSPADARHGSSDKISVAPPKSDSSDRRR